MSTITFTKRNEWVKFGVTRTVYELSQEVPYSSNDDVTYSKGSERTRFVVVSHGRDGDTVIFPSDDEGAILDYLGYQADYSQHRDPDEFMAAWIAAGAGVPA